MLLCCVFKKGGAGGKRMREEGVLEMEPKPKHAFGMHLWPTIPSGTIAGKPGPILAAAERFEVLIAGVGGHAAMVRLFTLTGCPRSPVVHLSHFFVGRVVSSFAKLAQSSHT